MKRVQCMFITIDGDVIFVTEPEPAAPSFADNSHHRAVLEHVRDHLDDVDDDARVRARYYSGTTPPKAGQYIEDVDGIEWTWRRFF